MIIPAFFLLATLKRTLDFVKTCVAILALWCYVGDGINDSIALIMPFGCKKAHVSVSMRGASTIATSGGDHRFAKQKALPHGAP